MRRDTAPHLFGLWAAYKKRFGEHSRRGAVAADDFCEEDPVLKNSTLEKRLFSVVENLLFSIIEFLKTGSSLQ